MFKRYGSVLLVMLPIGAVLGVITAGVVSCLMPKIYESVAVIQVKPKKEGGFCSTGLSSAVNTNCFPTQIDVIKSRNSLGMVIKNLDLTNRWNVDEERALQMLKSMISREDIPRTDLVSIRVRHSNKVDARDVALAVVEHYKQYRAELEGREVESVIHELTKAFKEQEDKVEERRKVLATIVMTQGVTFDGSDLEITPKPGDTSEEAINRSIKMQDYLDAKRDLEIDQELLQQLKLKLVGETIWAKIPFEGVVIHEMPVIAESPISPNVTLNLIFGAALGLLCAPLMTLPVVWVMNRR